MNKKDLKYNFYKKKNKVWIKVIQGDETFDVPADKAMDLILNLG